jgi:hypothetical protein
MGVDSDSEQLGVMFFIAKSRSVKALISEDACARRISSSVLCWATCCRRRGHL